MGERVLNTNDILALILSGVGGMVALISLIIAFNANKKSHELKNHANDLSKHANDLAKHANELYEENNRILQNQKFLGWSDVERYIDVIVQQMNNNEFAPDYIYVISAREANVGNMIAQRLAVINPYLRVYTGLRIPESKVKENNCDEYYDKRKHTSWGYIFLPKYMSIGKTEKVLIVDDCSVTGACFDLLVVYFKEMFNLEQENIKTASIACFNSDDMIIRERYNKPDYFCLKVKDEIWFPWGKNL